MRVLQIKYTELVTRELTPEDKKLEEVALLAARRAYAPYSKFGVGAAVLLDNGIVVSGSNQENAAYPSGTCAERTALFYAGSEYPEARPLKLFLVAINQMGRVEQISPCGSCRQVIMETAQRFGSFPIYLSGAEKTLVLEDCRELLPFGFDGSEL